MSTIAYGRPRFVHPSAKLNHAPGRGMGLVQRITGTLRLWGRRMRDRQALQQLSYRDMRDIGATPADIAWEISQPFWREPRRR